MTAKQTLLGHHIDAGEEVHLVKCTAELRQFLGARLCIVLSMVATVSAQHGSVKLGTRMQIVAVDRPLMRTFAIISTGESA